MPKPKRYYYLWSPTKGCFTAEQEFSEVCKPDLFPSVESALGFMQLLQNSLNLKFPNDTVVCSFVVGKKH